MEFEQARGAIERAETIDVLWQIQNDGTLISWQKPGAPSSRSAA